MIYKKGSRGDDVVKIQKSVGVSADGVYGKKLPMPKSKNLKHNDRGRGKQKWRRKEVR